MGKRFKNKMKMKTSNLRKCSNPITSMQMFYKWQLLIRCSLKAISLSFLRQCKEWWKQIARGTLGWRITRWKSRRSRTRKNSRESSRNTIKRGFGSSRSWNSSNPFSWTTRMNCWDSAACQISFITIKTNRVVNHITFNYRIKSPMVSIAVKIYPSNHYLY